MSADRPTRVTPSGAGTRRSLIIAVAVSAVALGLCAWLIVTDAPAYRFVVRLYEDKQLMHAMLARWGVLAPVVFIAIQALQVIIAPIPGEVTGLLGGFVFGPWLGFFYSTIGLTIGSLGHLLDPGAAEGHRVLSLRRQSDAVLGLRRGVHARAHAGNLGPVGPGREGGRWRVCPTDPSDRDRRRGRVTALLLPGPDRGVVPGARLTREG